MTWTSHLPTIYSGWKEGKLQELIDTCEPDRNVEAGAFNPPCSCAEENLTKNTEMAGAVCDSDVRRLILDEAIDVTPLLPAGQCQGATLIQKSWNQLADSTIQCTLDPGTPINFDEEEDGNGGDGDEDGDEDVDEDENEGRGGNKGTGKGGSASGVARNTVTLVFFGAIMLAPYFFYLFE